MTPIIADDPNKALSNATAIEDAPSAITVLPAGTTWVAPAPVLTSHNNGRALRGGRLESNQTTGDYMDRAALLVRAGRDGKAVLSWDQDETPESRPDFLGRPNVGWSFDGTGQTLARRILPGQAVPKVGRFMRAWRGVPFTTVFGETSVALPAGHGLTAGEYVFATDGPFQNECVGEFRRVLATFPGSVVVDRMLGRAYRQGTLVCGAFPSRQLISGVTMKGQYGSMVLQHAVGIRMSNLNVSTPINVQDHAAWLSLIGCGDCELRHCTLPGIGMSSGSGHVIQSCKTPLITAEQGQIEVTIMGCEIGWLDTRQHCDGWSITDCDFTDCLNGDLSLGIYDRWYVRSARCAGLVRVRGAGCMIVELATIGPVIVQHDYEGGPATAGTNVRINGVDAAYVELMPGTSGEIANCRAPIVCRDPATKAKWTLDGKPL